MAGAIWEDYSDGEILDEVMKRLEVEGDDMTGLFNRIDELLVHPWHILNSNKKNNMKYTVWVSGSEVTEKPVDRDTADEMLMDYRDEGYDYEDVWIDEVITKDEPTVNDGEVPIQIYNRN